MNNEKDKKFGVAGALNKIRRGLKWIGSVRHNVNEKMVGRNSPTLIGVFSALACTILLVGMLFISPYLGVADDGSVSKIMNAAGLTYMQDDPNSIYNNYYIKTYSNLSNYNGQPYKAGQVLFVKAAVSLDNMFTQDSNFDIRFLAMIYSVLFIPAIGLVIKQACSRVLYFSERVIVGSVGVIIFSDVSYITYFSSFYPEALWFISLLYCVGLGLSFQNNQHLAIKSILLMVFGIILISSRQQCAIIGVFLAVLCIRNMDLSGKIVGRVISILMAFVFSATTLVAYFKLDSDFTLMSKYHSMTRGVLFQANNPEQALNEFGINPAYSVLADTSLYQDYAIIDEQNVLLNNGFYDQYEKLDVYTYYLRHPIHLTAMFDIAIKAVFNVRRDFCGNYEQSTGRPEKSKSLFWSSWSSFKQRSAPKTVGYVIILIVACFMLFGTKGTLGLRKDRQKAIVLDVMIFIICVSFSQAILTIVNSGDAEFVQHGFLIALGIDLLTYFVFAEILHKLNIIEDRGGK